jgi:protein tyrosine/serine phosphatase
MKTIASASSKFISWSFLFALAFAIPLQSFGQSVEDSSAVVNTESPTTTTTKTTLPLETCKVKNFGKVTDFYFRGAQPKAEQYAQLAGIGVKTVIDLRDDAKDYAQSEAEAAGLVYLSLPMSDTKYPPQETIQRFLELIKDSANVPIYVHCAGGRHRTGIVTAVYRMTFEGWDIEKAYDEMKDYDFYTRWGHGAMKKFVFNYWNELQAKRKETALTPTATTVVP